MKILKRFCQRKKKHQTTRRKMNKKQLLALLASYGRSVLAGALALYGSGVTDPGQLVWALVAAIAPVVIRYINPNDVAFGRVPTATEVNDQITDSVTQQIKKK